MPQGRGSRCNGFSLGTTGGNRSCNTALLSIWSARSGGRKVCNSFGVWARLLQLLARCEIKRLENHSRLVMPDTLEYPKRPASRFPDSRIGVSQCFFQAPLEDF